MTKLDNSGCFVLAWAGMCERLLRENVAERFALSKGHDIRPISALERPFRRTAPPLRRFDSNSRTSVSASTKLRASAQVERPERFGFDLAVPNPSAGLRLKLSKRGGLAPIAWILFASSVSNVTGQTQPGQITYTTQTICENAKLLSLQDCKNAFVNANAELDEKAPRFSNRSECEHYFRYCMIGDIRGDSVHGKAKPRVSFIPALRAIVISGHSRGDRRVLPLVEGGKGGSLFQSRAVAETDSMESGEKTRRAQAAWAQQQAAAPAAANMASDPVYAPSEVDVEPKGGDPRCAALVNPFAYNACLARAGPKSKL